MSFELFPGLNPLTLASAVLTLVTGFLCGKFFSEFLSGFLKKYRDSLVLKRFDYDDLTAEFISFTVRYSLYLISIFLALAQLGFSKMIIQVFAALTIVLFLVILVFSLKDFIPNAAAGLYLMRTKLIYEGDNITVDSFSGNVKRVDLLNTTIITEQGDVVIIPNSVITKKALLKKTLEEGEEKNG